MGRRQELSPGQNARIRARMVRLMAEKGWNKSELARELGITPASYNGIEQGGGVSYQTARRLAELVGEDLTELMGEPDEEERPTRYSVAVAAARAMAMADNLDMRLFNGLVETFAFDEGDGFTAEQFYKVVMAAYRKAVTDQRETPDTSDIDEAPRGRKKRGTS